MKKHKFNGWNCCDDCRNTARKDGISFMRMIGMAAGKTQAKIIEKFFNESNLASCNSRKVIEPMPKRAGAKKQRAPRIARRPGSL